MDGLHAADSLLDFWPINSKPERVHELSGNMAGTFSIDLQHPFRLLFTPVEDPFQGDADGKKRWKAISKITITSVEDTHG